MKLIRSIFVLLVILVIIAVIIISVKVLTSGKSLAIKDENGYIKKKSIVELEKIEIGGMDQWILVRGNNRNNPILLWLHGGPGAAQMPVYKYTADLEKEFVVVHWDQRGAGKSNPKDFDENTMTIQQFINDTHELTQYLKKKFMQEKIYLLGHSWGTQIGIEMAFKYPEDYFAYIGMSQLVDPKRGNEIAYNWLMEKVKEKGNQKDTKTLVDIGLPPYKEHDRFVKFINMVNRFGGSFDLSMLNLAWTALQAPEYELKDYMAWINGANRGSGPMWEETQKINTIEQFNKIDIPVYFFSGKNDYNTPLKLVEEYYEVLQTKKKDLVIFENSAHTPCFNETEKFNLELFRVKEETYLKE